MRKGWFKKAKNKWINKNVYSYELTRRGTMGSDYVEVRSNQVRTVYFGSAKADWQHDMAEVGGFVDRFIWARELAQRQPEKFYFYYKTNKNLEY